MQITILFVGTYMCVYIYIYRHSLFFQQFKVAKSVYMNGMDIYETYNGGAITKIEVKNPDDTWFLMYSQPASQYQTARIFSPNLKVTLPSCFVNKVSSHIAGISYEW